MFRTVVGRVAFAVELTFWLAVTSLASGFLALTALLVTGSEQAASAIVYVSAALVFTSLVALRHSPRIGLALFGVGAGPLLGVYWLVVLGSGE